MKFLGINTIVQRLLWLFLKVATVPFIRFEVHGREHLDTATYPLIVAANHKRATDPFFVALAFPFFSPVFPIRFMAEDKQYKTRILEFLRRTRILFLVYFLLGAFPSRRGEGMERALETPARILTKDKNSVLIFPEGRRLPEGEIGEFKRGAVILSERTARPILPVAVRYTRASIRMRCDISFGILCDKPIQANTQGDTITLLHRRIQDLYEQSA